MLNIRFITFIHTTPKSVRSAQHTSKCVCACKWSNLKVRCSRFSLSIKTNVVFHFAASGSIKWLTKSLKWKWLSTSFLPLTATPILFPVADSWYYILITECLLKFNVNQSFDVLTLANMLKIALQQSHLLSNYDLTCSFAPIRFVTQIQTLTNRTLRVSGVIRCQIASAHFCVFVCVSLRIPTMMAIQIRTQTFLIHSINMRKIAKKRTNIKIGY